MAFPALAGLAIASFIKQFTWDIAKFLALRILLISICVTLIPIAIYNGWCLIMEQIMLNVSTQSDGVFAGAIIEISGFGAWIATNIRLGECLSIFFSALALKFTLSFFRR